jgi:cobalt-zinc-cadmium efflux system protein
VIVAALGLRWWNLAWIDPLASVLISVLIVVSAVSLMKEAVDILMEKAPESVEVAEVRRCLLTLPGVRDVHCLHVWRIASGRDSMSAHIVVEDDQLNVDQLQRARSALQERFSVDHITLQIEPAGFQSCSEQALEHCESRPCGAEPSSATSRG